jgi:phosphotriesterase-related protein
MKSRRAILKWVGMAPMASFGARAAAAVDAPVPIVQTVLGPLDASKLGVTLAHEHVADGPDVLSRWPKAWGGRAGLVARAVENLKLARAAGVGTIVDLTTYDVGRDIRFLEEVSRKSGLNMIACTGQRFLPPQDTHIPMQAGTIAGLTEFFKKELQQGIDGTAIKAGVIKIGIITNRPTALEEIGLRAAARASKATGVPIRTHTNAALRAGESHAAILEDEGINPARVSFDHSDGSGQMDYFLGLVKRGYSLGMDHVHRGAAADAKPSFERRADCIKQLVDAGFAKKVFLSQDAEFGGLLLPEEVRTWREKIDPAEGMLFTTQRLVPYLKKIGVSDSDIHTMTVDNPRAFFGQEMPK